MREPRTVVIEPIQTEKTTSGTQRNRAYTFVVARDSNKIQIRGAIESIYAGVKVAHVRTLNVKGKARRFKGSTGRQNDWKKAIVTLTEKSKPIEGF